MSVDILIVFGLLIVALLLFLWERVSFDVTALIVMSTLMVTGILTPTEGLAGFSNPATITIAAMFVLAEGVRRTGVLDIIGKGFSTLAQRRRWFGLGIMMTVIAVISAFINNTAAIAIFIPVVIGVAHDLGISPSKLLMPVSFASMFGGVCTLIGTSTNILVSSVARAHGLAEFGMFEFAPMGVVFLVAGMIYLFTVGIRLIPARRTERDMAAGFRVKEFLTDVVIEPGSEATGSTLEESNLTEDLDIDVVQVFKQSRVDEPGELVPLRSRHPLEAGDVLRIRGSAREIQKLVRRQDLSLRPPKEWTDADFEKGGDTLVEAVVAPDSPIEGKEVRSVDFFGWFGAVLLALRHHGELQQEDLGRLRLSGGDSVLLALDAERIPDVAQDRSFVLVSEVGLPHYRRDRMGVAIAILVGVVATVAFGLVPVVLAAVVGSVLLILTGCITSEEAYRAINWKVILLLAGVLPLGDAMDKTGAAGMLGSWAVAGLGQWGPVAVLSGFFLLTFSLTALISNQATAALLAPIAIEAGHTLGVDPRPFLMAVTFAASLSFMTPVGYQTNTLVYGPGQYRFSDFTRAGAPLNLLFWILATLLIPVFWEF